MVRSPGAEISINCLTYASCVIDVAPPWPVSKDSGYISPRLDLDKSLKLIRSCMELCANDHAKCRNFVGTLSTLPSRILDVSPDQEGNGIHLVEICEELGIFIPLSHCWGLVKFIQTTKATLEYRKRNIPFDELPLAFQNVVEITRGLGIQYLWID